MKTIVRYISEVRSELAKVVWPKRNDVIRLTLMVFIISGIVGIFIGILDFSFTKLLESVILN